MALEITCVMFAGDPCTHDCSFYDQNLAGTKEAAQKLGVPDQEFQEFIKESFDKASSTSPQEKLSDLREYIDNLGPHVLGCDQAKKRLKPQDLNATEIPCTLYPSKTCRQGTCVLFKETKEIAFTALVYGNEFLRMKGDDPMTLHDSAAVHIQKGAAHDLQDWARVVQAMEERADFCTHTIPLTPKK